MLSSTKALLRHCCCYCTITAVDASAVGCSHQPVVVALTQVLLRSDARAPLWQQQSV